MGIGCVVLHLSALGSRVGCGLEHIVQEVVEECVGQTLPFAERLVLHDETGEVYGVAGAECDLYAHHGVAYLVEDTSHLRSADVLMLYRKVRFAEGRLGRQVMPLIIVRSMESRAECTMRQLGIRYRVRATMDR